MPRTDIADPTALDEAIWQLYLAMRATPEGAPRAFARAVGAVFPRRIAHAHQRRYREVNPQYRSPELNRAAQRRYRAAHLEANREANRRYRAAHRDEDRERRRRYRAAYPADLEAKRLYRIAHLEVERRYVETHREVHREANRRYRAKKKAASAS
jgi:hypothetical protein